MNETPMTTAPLSRPPIGPELIVREQRRMPSTELTTQTDVLLATLATRQPSDFVYPDAVPQPVHLPRYPQQHSLCFLNSMHCLLGHTLSRNVEPCCPALLLQH